MLIDALVIADVLFCVISSVAQTVIVVSRPNSELRMNRPADWPN